MKAVKQAIGCSLQGKKRSACLVSVIGRLVGAAATNFIMSKQANDGSFSLPRGPAIRDLSKDGP